MRAFLTILMVAGLAMPATAQTATTADPAAPAPAQAQVDFGDDAGEWANDNECDDKRFTGPGMTLTPLLEEDVGHDATDCRTAFEAGQLTMFEPITEPVTHDGIDFGVDSSDWSHDNECDDPRFAGDGQSQVPAVAENESADATDCLAAYQAGTITLQ